MGSPEALGGRRPWGYFPATGEGAEKTPPVGGGRREWGGAVRHKDSAEGVWPLDRAVSAGLGLKTLTG